MRDQFFSKQKYPKPGTKLYDIYKKLYENRGHPVYIDYRKGSWKTVLEDFYLLDIIYCNTSTFMLIGEWIDGTYVDYLAESLDKERNKKDNQNI